MMRNLASVFCSVCLLAGWSAAQVNAQAAKAQAHVAAAKAAAYEPGQDFTRVFGDQLARYRGYGLCEEREPAPAPPAAPPQPPPKRYRLVPSGTSSHRRSSTICTTSGGSAQMNHNAWAVTTSAGIILFDTGKHYSAEELVVNGLKKMGLDPGTDQICHRD